MNQQAELIPRSTGDYLKQQRLERKLDLATVARDTGLDEQLLTDIETDRESHLAAVYKNGYIRVYARYLEIPEREIQTLLVSTENTQPGIRNIFSAPPQRNPMEKWLRATSYVLGSLLIGTLAWQFTHEAVRLSQNGSRLQNTEERAANPADRIKQDQAQDVVGTVNASIAPMGSLHDTGADGLDTAEHAWAAMSRPVLPDGESRIQVSVSADSWVEISDANGQELEMDLLRGGSDKSYHGQPPFRILLGQASAVHLFVDGEAVDLTGFARGDVAQLNWPQQITADNKGQDSTQ